MVQPHPKHALPIGHSIGGFEIVRVIGQGGFGIVYEAANPDTGERVAIKEFYPSAIATRQGSTIVVNNDQEADLYAGVLERFRSTAVLQYKFDHTNILKVRNYIRGENTGYMITDYVDGEPLREMLHQHGGHVPTEQVFRDVFRPIIGAVSYVHTRPPSGYLHRDISPDNIMIDQFGKPVLIDFGALKRDLRASNTFSSFVFVREDFSPPEQQERDPNRPEGFYTDVFALAGTMYCALAGHPPPRVSSRFFQADSDPYVPVAKASKINCPPDVFECIDRGLRLPMGERPQSVAEMQRMLGWDPPARPGAIVIGRARQEAGGKPARDGDWTGVQGGGRPPAAGEGTGVPGSGASSPGKRPGGDGWTGLAGSDAAAGAPGGPGEWTGIPGSGTGAAAGVLAPLRAPMLAGVIRSEWVWLAYVALATLALVILASIAIQKRVPGQAAVQPAPPAAAPAAPPMAAPAAPPAAQPSAPPPTNYAEELTDFGIAPQNMLQPNVSGATPTTIPGGRVVTTANLITAMRSNTNFVLVDAWNNAAHQTIAGADGRPRAVRIPFGGSAGTFNDAVQQRLAGQLTNLTSNNNNLPIVFFCASVRCWESYNASLRAITLGYQNVFWYRGGVAAWEAANQPLVN